MPGGRPTKYEPWMCEAVREFMSQGYSRMAAAGHIGVSYDAFREYQDKHEEFRQAVKFGQAARTMKLEEDLLSADTGPRATTRIFALKNAAPEEWRDKVHQEHDVPRDGGLASLLREIAENGGRIGKPD